jgi:hypothetical protein
MDNRASAIAALGESVVQVAIPFAGYRGLILEDLVQLWVAEQDRVWSEPPPKPVASPLPKRNGHTRPAVAMPEPTPTPPTKPKRQPLRPTRAANDSERLVTILRDGIEHGGQQFIVGDAVLLPTSQARQLVLNGAAEFTD